jgi:hypothetical protein
MKKIDICDRYISIKNEMKALKTELEELEKELRKDIEDDFMKAGSVAKTYGEYTVSLNEQRRTIADTQAMKDDGIFEKYSKPSIATMFKVDKK